MTDARLTELEMRLSFADDALNQLSDVITRQQVQIDRLTAQLAQLGDQVRALPQGENGASLRDELPPHY